MSKRHKTYDESMEQTAVADEPVERAADETDDVPPWGPPDAIWRIVYPQTEAWMPPDFVPGKEALEEERAKRAEERAGRAGGGSRPPYGPVDPTPQRPIYPVREPWMPPNFITGGFASEAQELPALESEEVSKEVKGE